MEQYFKLEFSRGGVYKAQLLTTVAPRTCESFLKALPISTSVLNSSFSGHTFYFQKSLAIHEVENPVVFGAQPGDIFLNTNVGRAVFEGEILPPRVLVAYGTSVVLWNWAGWTPSNHFAKVVEGDLGELWKIGRRLRWEGKEEIKCSLV